MRLLNSSSLCPSLRCTSDARSAVGSGQLAWLSTEAAAARPVGGCRKCRPCAGAGSSRVGRLKMACLLETPIRMSVLSVSDPPGAGQTRSCPQHYPGAVSRPSTTSYGGLRWDAPYPGRVGGAFYSRVPTGAASQDGVRPSGRSGSRQPARGRGLGLAERFPYLPLSAVASQDQAHCLPRFRAGLGPGVHSTPPGCG